MKKLIALLLLLCLLPLPGLAAEQAAAKEKAKEPEKPYTLANRKTVAEYDSETLKYTMESCRLNGTACYLTTVWVAEPGRQIKKAISPWHQHLAKAEDLANKIPDAALVINGSGYVSPAYPEIPKNYPGKSPDYYYTPLGSLTVVNGEVYRNLEEVPYYGLTLEVDGLHLYAGVDNETVLSNEPIQTWSFYEGCPMAMDGESLLDETWYFCTRKAIRTIIAKLPADNTYLILTATATHGLSLIEANEFLEGEFHPEWVYDLDGGPSTALFRRLPGKKTLKLIYGAGQQIVDVMGFVE